MYNRLNCALNGKIKVAITLHFCQDLDFFLLKSLSTYLHTVNEVLF